MIDIVTKRYVGKIGCRLAVGLACMYGPLRASVHLSALVDNVRMARMNFKERTSTTQCPHQSPRIISCFEVSLRTQRASGTLRTLSVSGQAFKGPKFLRNFVSPQTRNIFYRSDAAHLPRLKRALTYDGAHHVRKDVNLHCYGGPFG